MRRFMSLGSIGAGTAEHPYANHGCKGQRDHGDPVLDMVAGRTGLMPRQPGREVLCSLREVHDRQAYEHDGKHDASDDERLPIGHDARLAYRDRTSRDFDARQT